MKSLTAGALFVVFAGLVTVAALTEEAGSGAKMEGSASKETVVIAPSADEIQPLRLGTKAPMVQVRTVDGKAISLAAAANNGPAAVIFYRGGWCPFCNRHLQALREAEPKLKEMGYTLLAISPDRPEELAKTAKKDDLDYTLLSDSTLEAAKAFGVAFKLDDATLTRYAGHGIDLEASSGEKHHALPVPSVFIVDGNGVIQYSYANPDYKVRLDNDTLLAAAKESLVPYEGSDTK